MVNLGLMRVPKEDSNVSVDVWLTERNSGEFGHVVRAALRREQWQRLALRRDGFMGMQDGVDRKLTGVLSSKLRGLERYRLRCLQAGALPTAQKLHKQKRLDSPLRLACEQAVETTRHIVRQCPAYEALRFREIPEETWDLLPDCMVVRGIVPVTFAPHWRPDERAGFVGTLQYTLLDILSARDSVTSWRPQPRWQPRAT